MDAQPLNKRKMQWQIEDQPPPVYPEEEGPRRCHATAHEDQEDASTSQAASYENVWLCARHWAMQIQRERVSIPKVGMVIRSLDD